MGEYPEAMLCYDKDRSLVFQLGRMGAWSSCSLSVVLGLTEGEGNAWARVDSHTR